MFSSLVGAKLVIVAVAGSLSIGGVAAAATGTIPGPFRNGSLSANDDQGASGSPPVEGKASADPSETADPSESATPTPSADPSTLPSPSATRGPTGPDATGPAAFGLCHAFGGSKALSKADNPSVARRNLLTAATAAGQTIEDYCAVVLGTPLPTTTPAAASADLPGGRGHVHGHGQGKGHGHGGRHL